VDFRDTSRWEGRRKPKNWARTAPVPDWWREVIGPAPVPLAVEYRPPGDLEASLQAMKDQYGRKLGLWFFLEGLKGSQALPVVAADLMLQVMALPDEGDWKILQQLHPKADPAQLREWFCTNLARAQAWADRPQGTEATAPPC
jgi:hypothetical protein